MACQVCGMHDGKRLAGRRAVTRRAGCPVPPGSGPARRQAAGLAPVVLRRACWKKTTIAGTGRSEEHTSELQSLMRISYAVFCLKKKNRPRHQLINLIYQRSLNRRDATLH